MWLTFTILLLIGLGLLLVAFIILLSATSDQDTVGVSFIFIISGVVILFWASLALYTLGQSHPGIQENMKKFNIYEVISVIPYDDYTEENKFVALLKNPEGNFELYDLDHQPPLGLVMVNDQKILVPYPDTPPATAVPFSAE